MIVDKPLQQRLLARNIRYSYLDGMTFSLMLGASTPYLGVYVLRFNGSPELVSLITAIQPFVLAIVSLLAASFANSFQKKKALLVPASLITRSFILLIAFIPFLPNSWHAWAFFILWGMMYIPWSYCTLSWAPLIGNLIPDEQRGRFFGTRNALTGITTLIGTFLTGIVLAKFDFLSAFTGIFILSFLATMVSLYYLTLHIEPVVAEPGETKHQSRRNSSPLIEWNLADNLKTFNDPDCGKIFCLISIAIFIFHLGYSMAIPLFVIRQINQLGFDNGAVALIANVSAITAFLGSYLCGQVSDRWGYRYVLCFSTLLLVIPPLIWALAPPGAWLIFAAALWGFMGNAYLICFQYMVLAIAPYHEQARFVAINTVVGNLAGCLGPILGLCLLKLTNLDVQEILIAASVIMFIGSIFSVIIAKKGRF